MTTSARGFRGIVIAAIALATTAHAQDGADKGAAHDAEIVKRFPPPGRMVDIGDRRLHLLCKGPETGPTVILEAGAFGSSVWYWKAQDEVAKVTRACTYDRAGLGWSDPAPLPRPLVARVDDLHALLAKSGLNGPYIVAGHSMGGLLARMLVRKYPRDVAALILIESSEEQLNSTPESQARSLDGAKQLGMAITALSAGTEIQQLKIPGGPPEQDIIQRASVFTAGQDDLIAMSHLAEELRALGGSTSLGNLPVVVIQRGKVDPGRTPAQTQEWTEAQARIATLSTRSVSITAERSGHNVMFDQPELYAQAVQKILEMSKQ